MSQFPGSTQIAIVVALCTAAGTHAAASAECVAPGETAVVDGLLSVKTLPGPPRFENVRRGDAPEEAVLLSAYTPVCFKTEQAGERYLYTFHIIPNDDVDFRSQAGQSVRVTGVPAEGTNLHHRTPVIIENADIMPVAGRARIKLSEPATTLLQCVRKNTGNARIDRCGDSLSNFCIGRLQSEHAISPQDEQICLMQEAVAWNEIYRATLADRVGIPGAVTADEKMEDKVRRDCSRQETKCSIRQTDHGRRCVVLYLTCTLKGAAREAVRTLDAAAAVTNAAASANNPAASTNNVTGSTNNATGSINNATGSNNAPNAAAPSGNARAPAAGVQTPSRNPSQTPPRSPRPNASRSASQNASRSASQNAPRIPLPNLPQIVPPPPPLPFAVPSPLPLPLPYPLDFLR